MASVQRPVPHSEDLPIPFFRDLSDRWDTVFSFFEGESVRASDEDDYFEATSSNAVLFSQPASSGFIRDLGLSKKDSNY